MKVYELLGIHMNYIELLRILKKYNDCLGITERNPRKSTETLGIPGTKPRIPRTPGLGGARAS